MNSNDFNNALKLAQRLKNYTLEIEIIPLYNTLNLLYDELSENNTSNISLTFSKVKDSFNEFKNALINKI